MTRPEKKNAAAGRRAAIHEAGHCLAYWWNGQFIYRAVVCAPKGGTLVIDRRGREVACTGLVEGSSFIANPVLMLDRGRLALDDEVLDGLERDLLHCYCGPIAEARHSRVGVVAVQLSAGSEDYSQARRLLEIVPDEMRSAIADSAHKRSKALVRRYWPAVQAVADLLQRQGDVEGEAIVELLASTTGEKPTWKSNPLSSLDLGAAA